MRNHPSWDILLKQRLFLMAEHLLDEVQPAGLEWWHQVAHYRKLVSWFELTFLSHVEPEVFGGAIPLAKDHDLLLVGEIEWSVGHAKFEILIFKLKAEMKE